MKKDGLASRIIVYSNLKSMLHRFFTVHFRVPKLLTLFDIKRDQAQNLSCENEFYLHNKKSFSQERFCTWPRFKTEACGISEMAFYFFYSSDTDGSV